MRSRTPTFPPVYPVERPGNVGKIYVTYAPAGRAAQTAATHGVGIVNIFDENGVLLETFVTGSQLARLGGSPLLDVFGAFGGDLLVGNFSFVASEINAFDAVTGAFEGTIPINVGAGNTPGGLWGLCSGVAPATVAMPTLCISPMGSTARQVGSSRQFRPFPSPAPSSSSLAPASPASA